MSSRWTSAMLIPIGAFMFWAAGHYTVFDDEAYSCRRYVAPVGEMIAALRAGVEPDPPFYYLLQAGWVRLFGVGPVGLRSMSILAFLAALPLVRLAGRVWFDDAVGRLAMVLAALHPAHLLFGFAARWYALVFLEVAALVYVTGRIVKTPKRQNAKTSKPRGTCEPGRPQPRSTTVQSGVVGLWIARPTMMWMIAWGLIAAALCYTNYFGVVVAGLVWAIVFFQLRSVGVAWRGWIAAALIAGAAFVPWATPFIEQAGRFPEVGGSWLRYAGAAGHVGLTLLTGNLASLHAWWAWGPMLLFATTATVMAVRRIREIWPLYALVIGCFVVGVASLSMKDKYVMTFSGPMCIVIAAVLLRSWRACANARPRLIARIAVGTLVLGWCGCMVNLVLERHWSSLRWLDEYDRALADVAQSVGEGAPPVYVVTHPSGRYYLSVRHVQRAGGVSIDAHDWRHADEMPDESLPVRRSGAAAPRDLAPFFLDAADAGARLPSLVTIETAAYRDDPDWRALHAVLARQYEQVGETRRYARDPMARLKDRLDPRYDHPEWRIVVRHWRVRY